ncbi:MAG: hypothetical protein H6670_10245 [Anaerolineaceae bacterium]|nr:hypothetical protein [Anaerolineaceae bacterium]
MRSRTMTITIALGLIVMFLTSLTLVQAGNIVLSNNAGDGNAVWVIEGEQTLVMNGFDLNSRNLALPLTLDAITISVNKAVPGASVDALIYADADGGSPSNATLLSRQSVQINSTGSVRIALPNAVTVNAPVIWVGFYLPIGFEFNSDTSGASVLTYWAWTPGATFDVNSLANAQVLGPSDGTSPVNINLGGIARISAEVTQANGATTPSTTPVGSTVGSVPEVNVSSRDVPIGVQMVAQSSGDLSVLSKYRDCGELLFYDSEDIRITGEGRFELHCRADVGAFSPGVIENYDQVPDEIPSFNRHGYLYDIFGTGSFLSGSSAEQLVVPVTHCIRPEQADLNTAVLGIAYGAPRAWHLLPSVRYGEVICAEMTHQGFLSYFVPRTGNEATLNANLYFSGTPRLIDSDGNRVGNEVRCGFAHVLQYSVHNEGFEPTPPTTVRVQDFHVRTGTIARSNEYDLGPVPPGGTLTINIDNYVAPSVYYNEAHRMVFTIDPGNRANEANEGDNSISIDFLLTQSTQCVN